MRRIAILLILVLVFASCQKEEPRAVPVGPPPVTTYPGKPAVGAPSAVPTQVESGTITVVFGPGGGDRIFNVNGQPYGHVNVPTSISAGTYRIDLGEPRNYEPASITVAVEEQQGSTVTFRRTGDE